MMLYHYRWIFASLASAMILLAGYFLDIQPHWQNLAGFAAQQSTVLPRTLVQTKIQSLVPQKKMNARLMQAIQDNGLHLQTLQKTDDDIFQLTLSGEYDALHRFVAQLPSDVWLKQFHFKAEKNYLTFTMSVLLTQPEIVLQTMYVPQHNPFCLPRLIRH